MLSKYHNLPDHFHDLKTTLQAEFELLKTATSKNIQSINEAVESQQAYMTVLYGHINTLYTKLAHLDKQVQIHCIYPHPQSDVTQLNVPNYDPDICRASARPPAFLSTTPYIPSNCGRNAVNEAIRL